MTTVPKRKQSVGNGRSQGVVGVTTEPKRKCNVGSGEVGKKGLSLLNTQQRELHAVTHKGSLLSLLGGSELDKCISLGTASHWKDAHVQLINKYDTDQCVVSLQYCPLSLFFSLSGLCVLVHNLVYTCISLTTNLYNYTTVTTPMISNYTTIG